MAKISQEEFLAGGNVKLVTQDAFIGGGGVKKVQSQASDERNGEGKGFFKRVGERLTERRTKGIQKIVEAEGQTPVEDVFQFAGQGLGAISDIGFEATKSAAGFVGGLLPEAIKDPFREVGDDIVRSKIGQAGIGALAGGIEQWENFAKDNPRTARNIVSAAHFAEFLPIGKVVQTTSKPIVTGSKTAMISVGQKTLGTATLGPKVTAGTFRTGLKVFGRGKETIETNVERLKRVSKLPPDQANAVRSGLDEQVVNFISTAGKEDVSSFKKMFDIAKSKAGDLRFRTQPKEVVGDTILKRAEFLINKKNDVGKKLGKTIASMPDRTIDITEQYNQFLRDLRRFGVSVTNSGRVRSDRLPQSDLKFIQEMVDSIRPNKEGKVLRTPKFISDKRKQTFDRLDLAKARQEAFSESVDIIGEDYRTLLMNPLASIDENYRILSKEFAEIIQPLKEFVSLIQFKGKLDDVTTKDLRVAEVAQRILGSASDRPNSVIEALEHTAIEFGYKATDDVFDQILFSDLLENFFGTFQTRSLRGQVGRAFVDAARGFDVGDIQRKVTAFLTPTEQEQIRALEKLLNSLIKK